MTATFSSSQGVRASCDGIRNAAVCLLGYLRFVILSAAIAGRGIVRTWKAAIRSARKRLLSMQCADPRLLPWHRFAS